MATDRGAHPTKQARSQRTQDQLLEAAEAVLAEGGLDVATVPAIAERAGLSVGVVYRRFPDKDALLRAVYERFFTRSIEGNRAALSPERWKGASVEHIIGATVGGIVRSYTEKRGLLRALFRYAESHPDPEFRRRAEELNSASFRMLSELLLSREERIGHPDPVTAIPFAYFLVGAVLRATMHGASPATNPYAESDERLAEELTWACLAYLGVEP
jgi:AcrR family transcriptional regulator